MLYRDDFNDTINENIFKYAITHTNGRLYEIHSNKLNYNLCSYAVQNRYRITNGTFTLPDFDSDKVSDSDNITVNSHW